jgi:hypothetical protein
VIATALDDMLGEAASGDVTVVATNMIAPARASPTVSPGK